MFNHTLKLTALIVVPAAILSLTGCNSSPNATETTTYMETADGAAIVDTVNLTGTINAINTSTRKITLTTSDGSRTTCKVDRTVDLSRLKVGDRVSVTVTEELAVAMWQTGAPPSVSNTGTIALASAGSDRAMWVADTVQATAKVTKVDTKHRKVTLLFPDGRTKTFKVHKDVNLANVQPGSDVTVQVSESVAIAVMGK